MNDAGSSNHIKAADAIKKIFKQEYPNQHCSNMFLNKAAAEVCKALGVENPFANRPEPSEREKAFSKALFEANDVEFEKMLEAIKNPEGLDKLIEKKISEKAETAPPHRSSFLNRIFR